MFSSFHFSVDVPCISARQLDCKIPIEEFRISSVCDFWQVSLSCVLSAEFRALNKDINKLVLFFGIIYFFFVLR